MALLDIVSGFWGLRRQLEALVGLGLTDAVLQQAGANGGASFARAFFTRAFVGAKVTDGGRALRDCIAAYQAAGLAGRNTSHPAYRSGRRPPLGPAHAGRAPACPGLARV